uniref:Uncharacterized protein n=1 Tax=Anguilla anguilla TaxID=7936 RepID=A0A0E9QDB4_ANGAN
MTVPCGTGQRDVQTTPKNCPVLCVLYLDQVKFSPAAESLSHSRGGLEAVWRKAVLVSGTFPGDARTSEIQKYLQQIPE